MYLKYKKEIPPLIPYIILKQCTRMPTGKLDEAFERALHVKFKAPIKKYRLKIAAGKPGENDFEIWVIKGVAYFDQKWAEELQDYLEIHDFPMFR